MSGPRQTGAAVRREPADGRPRLDQLLVERGLAETREKARRMVMAGDVAVEGCEAPKPGQRMKPDAAVSVRAPERYVSRGGLKLEAALAWFGIDVSGAACADIGASTGGFTDCLLAHGAAHVMAVDVGASQMHERLKRDPRVTLVERCNARNLGAPAAAGALAGEAAGATGLPEPPAVFAVDVSFISLAKILPALARVAAPGAVLVALVKPQFEAGRADVDKGRGVVRDPAVHRRVLLDALSGVPAWGWTPHGVIPSPIEGGSGNREFLMHATLAPSDGMPDCAPTAPRDWADEVDAALAGTNVSPPPA